jgi:hypothetical protein
LVRLVKEIGKRLHQPTGRLLHFKVKARNNLRNESTVSSYSFTVLPPWYQTTIAYIFYAFLIITLAYLLYRKQQKKLLRERQKHIEEQKRTVYLHQLELGKVGKRSREAQK